MKDKMLLFFMLTGLIGYYGSRTDDNNSPQQTQLFSNKEKIDAQKENKPKHQYPGNEFITVGKDAFFLINNKIYRSTITETGALSTLKEEKAIDMSQLKRS